MKRKTFKKALAGISAAAMLISAMPVSMIATAGDLFYSVPVTDTLSQFTAYNSPTSNGVGNGSIVANASEDGFGAFYDALVAEYYTAAGTHALDMSPISSAPKVEDAEDKAAKANFTLSTFDFRMARYADRTADTITVPATSNTKATYYSTKWDTDKAKAEILQYVENATDVTFYTDSSNAANWGKIKTITMSMPYNNNGTIAYKEIEFTVIRSASDFKTAVQERYGAIILAADIAANDLYDKPVYVEEPMNINLNGHYIETQQGFTVNASGYLRVWGGTIKTQSTSTFSAINLYETTSAVELYDGVSVTTDRACTSAVIAGKGKLVCTGEANILNGNTGKLAVDTGTTASPNVVVVANGYTVKVADTTKYKAEIRKARTFNTEGVEVDANKKYVDIDPVTPGTQYSYQPAFTHATTTEVDLAANGPLSDGSTIDITNAGQLYWVAKHINAGDLVAANGNITIHLENDINMSAVGALETFTPINTADDWDLGNVTFDGQNHVIKNLKAASASGSAGLFSYAGRKDPAGSKTCAQTVTIENLGMENATVTANATSGYASAIVGEGYDVDISNSYVLNPTLTGYRTGALAGKLDGASTVNHTYSSGKYNGIRYLVDDATKNYFKTSSALTPDGQTNFYNSGVITETVGDTFSYMVAATDAEFTSGKVAYVLNGHNPTQQESKPNPWDNGSGSSPSVNYNSDVFGQTLGGTTATYPTFIKTNSTTGVRENNVYRQLSQSCDGTISAWTAVAADLKFGNAEMDYSSGHEDNGEGRCKHCGAYRIETHFDEVLWPYLKSTDAAEYNSQGLSTDRLTTTPNSIDGEYINLKVIADMTAVTIDLTKADSKKTVDKIVEEINTLKSDKTCNLKGFDILCNGGVSGKELVVGNKPITRVNFIVDDEVICKVYDDTTFTGAEDIANIGFKAVSYTGTYNDTTNNRCYDYTSVTSASSLFGAKTGLVPSASETDASVNSNVLAYDSTTKALYVAASIDTTNGSSRYAAFKSVYDKFPADDATNGWYQPTRSYDFVIQFSGVKHNDQFDKDALDTTNDGWNTTDTGLKATLDIATGDSATHTLTGKTCKCVQYESHTSDTYTITTKGHTGTCSICKRVNSSGGTSGAAEEAHDWEILQVFGNLTFKRCTVCGYVTITKDTNVTVGTPALSQREGLDENNKAKTYWRQTYDFNITAGDGEIVSYGAIVKKNPTATQHIDNTKVSAAVTSGGAVNANLYFKGSQTTGISLNETELVSDGLSYTARKGFKTNGTYRVNIDLENVDDAAEVVGYVIYKAHNGNYAVKTTATNGVTKNTFEELAKAEMEACNFASGANHEVASDDNKYERFYFTFDLDPDYTFVKFGALVTKSKTNPVTEKTTLDDVSTDSSATLDNAVKASTRSGKIYDTVKSVKYAAKVPMTTNETATVRAYAVITDKYGLTWEIYSEVQTCEK